jgi:folate-binding protein YgfZ
MPALPPDYGSAEREYAAARAGAGLVDRRDWGVLEVTGRDRAAFLHAILSNEVKALAPGTGCAATLLDVHAKVQEILVVWVLDDRILLVVPPGRAEKALQEIDHYLFAEKAILRDVSAETALFLVAGPEAPALVGRLTGVALGEAPWSHAAGVLDGASVRVVRGGGETGEPEAWVAAAAAAGESVRVALVGAGAAPVGATALEALRIEAGTPRLGADLDDSVLLPEVPFQHLVSHTKGCYPGQEVIVRIRDRGHVNRMLCGLVLEGEAPPVAGAEVLAGEAVVGRVTSAAWSWGRRRAVALALVRREHGEPGTALSVREGARTSRALVSALPFPR